MEFFLEFQGLVARVTGSGPLAIRLWNINPPSQEGLNTEQHSASHPVAVSHPRSEGVEVSAVGQARRALGRQAQPREKRLRLGSKLSTAAFTLRPEGLRGGGGKRETQARTEQ